MKATHLDQSVMIKIKKQKTNNTNNIDTKPPNVFNYLTDLSREANDLMDEIEEVDENIDIYNLAFIGSNKGKFNFNTFRMPLNFLSDIYNGKISLEEAEFAQREIEKKIEWLQFNYEPKNKKEKEEIERVFMHAKDLIECRDKIIKAFKDGTFRFEHLKKIRYCCL